MSLTKAELVNQLSVRTNLSKKDVEKVIAQLPSIFQNNQDSVIALPGIGRFSKVTRAARNAINPKTKEKVQVPAKKTVTFKPAKELLDSLS